MKSSKSLFTLTACALVAAAVPAFADASYTATATTDSSGNIIASTGDATLQLDGSEPASSVSGANFSLSGISGTLEISGCSSNSISSVTTNGGYGGRVSFASGSSVEGLTGITFNDGIEANVTNIQSASGFTITFDNASFFGGTSAYAFDMNVGSGGVRLNGNSGDSYTYAGKISGSGNIYAVSGNSGQTVTFTGDTSGFTGSWLRGSGNRTWVFGSGSESNTSVGGAAFGSSSNKLTGLTFNYNSDYTVAGDVYATALTVSGGNATLSGTTIDAGTVSVASGATATIASGSTLSGVTTISGAGTLTVNGTLSLAGTLTNSATLAFGSGSNITLTGDLATAYGDDYVTGGYVDKDGASATDGNGYVESASVTVISNTGTLSGESDVTVTHSDSSGVLSGTLDSSGKVSFGADYRTYHLNSAGETAFDSSIFHADTTTVSVASGATLKLENETTSFDSRTLSIGGAGTVELNVHDTTEQKFSTANVLTGDISVVKTGTGDAALSAAQSYTGGTTVEAGRICVGDNAALGTGTVTLSGGTLIAQKAVSLANAVHVTSSESTINTNSATVTISGAVSAADDVAFKKTGAGTLVLSGTANLGTLNVGAGAVQLSSTSGNYSTAGTRFDVGTVSLANGTTLQTVGQGFSFDSVSVADNGTGTLQLTDTSGVLNQTVTIGELSGTNATLNLASTVTLNTNPNGYYAQFTLGSADTTVSGDDFSGTIHIQNTAANTRQSSVIIANENIAKNAVMTFDKSGHSLGLGLTASNVNIAGLTSDSTTTGSVTVFSGTNSGAAFASDGTARTLTINASSDYTYAGTILGDVNLVKEGAGTQTLNGASASFDGEVSVRAGVLALGNAAAIGGTADAKTSVTIDGGQMSVAQNVELNATAITVVLSDAYSSAAAILGEGSLALGTTVTLDMDLASSVAALAAETAQTTYSYHLFGNTSLSQNLGEDAIALSDSLTAAGYTFSFDSASGVVTLSMIPEPSAFGLLAGLGALALVASRRRRRAK